MEEGEHNSEPFRPNTSSPKDMPSQNGIPGQGTNFTFDQFKEYMEGDMRKIVAESVQEVTNQVKQNTADIVNLAREVADI